MYIDVNIATPGKLFGDKESDVNENLWSLKVSDLEPEFLENAGRSESDIFDT